MLVPPQQSAGTPLLKLADELCTLWPSQVVAVLQGGCTFCRYDITSLDKITAKEDVEGERESAK